MKAYVLVLKYHGAGFYSIFNKLMNYLQFYTPIYKIVWEVECPHCHYGRGEIMSKVFESYIDETYKIYEIETIICNEYLDNTLTGQQALQLYTQDGCKAGNIPLTWRSNLNEMYKKYIHLKPHVQQNIHEAKELISQYNKKKIITMLIRHPALAREQPNEKMPEFSQYEDEIRKISPNLEDTLIVCLTDHMEAYEYFQSRYSGIMIFPSVDRASTNREEAHCSRERNDDAVVEAVLSIYYLTMGDDFIHHTSNMSTAVLYINPLIKNHFVVG
jgi:hypothetical protein